ncbi:hypothetical protein U9M48_027696 [Paspalum notatum var. saurae]|uniref:Uncharacterized protein n=1 Tax=Paspalum notatum var. saurae TaxID=547442 RepID=A0AAQ3WZU0_PASNO
MLYFRIFWPRNRELMVSHSSTETEYRVVANGLTKASWLRQLLQKLHHPPPRATLVYCESATMCGVYLSSRMHLPKLLGSASFFRSSTTLVRVPH